MFCTSCGTRFDEGSPTCEICGATRPKPAPPPSLTPSPATSPTPPAARPAAAPLPAVATASPTSNGTGRTMPTAPVVPVVTSGATRPTGTVASGPITPNAASPTPAAPAPPPTPGPAPGTSTVGSDRSTPERALRADPDPEDDGWGLRLPWLTPIVIGIIGFLALRFLGSSEVPLLWVFVVGGAIGIALCFWATRARARVALTVPFIAMPLSFPLVVRILLPGIVWWRNASDTPWLFLGIAAVVAIGLAAVASGSKFWITSAPAVGSLLLLALWLENYRSMDLPDPIGRWADYIGPLLVSVGGTISAGLATIMGPLPRHRSKPTPPAMVGPYGTPMAYGAPVPYGEGMPSGAAPYGAPMPGAVPMGYWAPPSTNGFAVASLVLGIISGWLLAIIFGAIALSQIKRSGGRQTGRGMAIAGLVLGIVWFLAYAALGIFLRGV